MAMLSLLRFCVIRLLASNAQPEQGRLASRNTTRMNIVVEKLGKQLEDNAMDRRSKMFENLLERSFQMSPSNHAKLEHTTLGKSHHSLTEIPYFRHGMMILPSHGTLVKTTIGQYQAVIADDVHSKSNPVAGRKKCVVSKPLGLEFGFATGGLGARIVDIVPGGNSARACGMIEAMRLVSINGVPCKSTPFFNIMASLRDLDSNKPIQLEMEAARGY